MKHPDRSGSLNIETASSDEELIRLGYEIERFAAALGGRGPGSGLASAELAVLCDRILAVPATGIAGAAIKLRALILGSGEKLDKVDLRALGNVLAVLEDVVEPAQAGFAAQMASTLPAAILETRDSSIEATIEGLATELADLATRHRTLIARNLELRGGAGTIKKFKALRSNFDTLEMALAEEGGDHAASEPKFLALYGYWNARRGDRTMPRRADIDPLDLADLWPDLALWNRESPEEFRCKLCGSRISFLLEDDPSGKLMSEMMHPFWTAERSTLGVVARSGRPGMSSGTVEAGKVAYAHRSLMLPLGGDGAVDMLLTATIFRDPEVIISQSK